MNRNDCSGFRRDRGSNRFRRDVLAMAVYIDANRTCAAHNHTTRGGDEGTGCGNNFISRPNPQSMEGQFQGQRSVGYAYPVFGPDMIGKFTLEKTAFLPSPIVDLPRAKHGSHSLDFIAREIRPG